MPISNSNVSSYANASVDIMESHIKVRNEMRVKYSFMLGVSETDIQMFSYSSNFKGKDMVNEKNRPLG